ncbi:MAG: DUF2442 domain-containing protein [Phycisphaeraceae bacterium]
MTTLVLDKDPSAVNVVVDGENLRVDLADGRAIVVPLSWYPRLLHASSAERSNWQLLGEGYAVEWPDLDEHIGIEGLLAGRRSGESESSFHQWLSTRSKQ